MPGTVFPVRMRRTVPKDDDNSFVNHPRDLRRRIAVFGELDGVYQEGL
jgi:hypothetical protein